MCSGKAGGEQPGPARQQQQQQLTTKQQSDSLVALVCRSCSTCVLYCVYSVHILGYFSATLRGALAICKTDDILYPSAIEEG